MNQAASPSFLWHDYETTGANPRVDRPLQFAAWRTDAELQPIGDPIVLWCAPPLDRLPSPDAGLVTGLAPQDVAACGSIEADFAAGVHATLSEPGTCGVGWNSLRFDDEFTRNLLYRNFHDPYAREWERGNSRWDLIDLARMCYALRPQGIQWPQRDDGAPSFRLGDLAAANGLVHRNAHDALGDVEATLALGRLLRERQPRLFDWYFALRQKRRAFEQLDWVGMTPVLHVSQRYPASQACLAMVVPLAAHPRNPNAVIVYDLAVPPDGLIDLPAVDVQDRVFTARRDLPDEVRRVPLKLVQANRSPALAPLSTLREGDARRIGLDVDACLNNLDRLRNTDGLAEKVRSVFAADPARPPARDPEQGLYDGFLPDADRALLRRVRSTPPEALADPALRFSDPRYPELLFRYRARNWPHTLDAEEYDRWRAHCQRNLLGEAEPALLNLGAYEQRIAALRETASQQQHLLLDRYLDWGRQLTAGLTA